VYIPAHFRQDDRAALFETIRAHAFGLLVTQTAEGPFATHLPFLVEEDAQGGARLLGHMARANPQWRHFAEGAPALAVFQGPHAYVSPTWYAKRAGSVPTWNYVAVHVYGHPQIIEEPAAVDHLLSTLSGTYEAGRPDAWSMAELTETAREGLRRGIVAFALPVERIEGKSKLSQNRSAEDRAGVVAGLEGAGDAESLGVAQLMR